MLGLTWVLGLFAVNRNTSVFAWIFAVINSLQVRFEVHHVTKTPRPGKTISRPIDQGVA
jgi:hypothetical protein